MNWSLEGDGVGEPFLFARQTQGSRQGLTGTDAHVPKLVRWRRRAVYTLPARRRQNISRILAAVPLSMTRLGRRLLNSKRNAFMYQVPTAQDCHLDALRAGTWQSCRWHSQTTSTPQHATPLILWMG
jgi:hypothetical protein